MPRDGGVSCLRRSEMIGIGIGELESPPLDSDQVHVLAVDDSLVDRIVIERLLRITSCKVTAVDSGWRALEFLGLDDDKASVEFDESTSFREVPVVIMSSENVLTRIDRCLEEGAEDFLLKPVKLADVKRLRNYLTRDVKVADGNKSKLPENLSNFSYPAPITPLPPPSTTAMESLDTNSRPLPPVDFVSSSPPSPIEYDDSLTTSPESLTSPVDSPMRRLEMRSPGLD
ncbi:unnamed protein product [Thlaspi arvense]|uniref:Response regulatory domain-containing protein n=1 Tax=Thlaspi arvense TaxID=13288 RepID=A0AAU9RPH6_THLAR|nr:unnamed protein product [Thlaspi arvense]